MAEEKDDLHPKPPAAVAEGEEKETINETDKKAEDEEKSED